MNDVKVSRYISYILRHNPSDAGLLFDEDGYVDVCKFVSHLDKKYSGFGLKDLVRIVEEDNKGRYSFDSSLKRIRANQGHSVISIEYKKVIPSKDLYHGTTERFLKDIIQSGIKKMSRSHVHLSDNIETAISVGGRHGVCCVLEIDVQSMIRDEIEFFISENGVYLTEYISPRYIKNVIKV